MSNLKNYVDDLWLNEIRSFSQLSPSQCTTLMGYILRDYYDNEVSDFMAFYDPKDLINYFLAHDMGTNDMLAWVDRIEEVRTKYLDSVKSHLAKSLRDTIDMLFEEKEVEAEQDEIDELPEHLKYKHTAEYHYGRPKTL